MYIALFSALLPLQWQQVASELHPLSDEFIDLINKQGKWKAGRNFHPDTPMSYIDGLLGAKFGNPGERIPKVQHDLELINCLPESFDPRENWPNCPSLNEIRDQGLCGSCRAIAAVEAMTDRVCTYSNGTKNFHFSAHDLISCNDLGGCVGEAPYKAWDFWLNEGIVSGGNYDSKEGCMPYQIPPCQQTSSGTNCTEAPTQSCTCTCRSDYSLDYKTDKRHGSHIYQVLGEDNMKSELFKNGPIEVGFNLYADFYNYKGGVYEHDSGDLRGRHAVKMLGWGKEGGKKYWLIANSWNISWGDAGFFKIRRGMDECGIESGGVAGDP